MKTTLTRVAAALVATAGLLLTTAPAAHATKPPPAPYRNCTDLNDVYPHGVGKVGAKDETNGLPVPNFFRDNDTYRLNKRLDRDKDGIACEKH